MSCGAAHSACVTDKGEVYVWGCGDGGRLGLGIDKMGTAFRPVHVRRMIISGYVLGEPSIKKRGFIRNCFIPFSTFCRRCFEPRLDLCELFL